jgi:hypothetical protein
MSSQIVILSASVLDAICDHTSTQMQIAFDSRSMHLRKGCLADGTQVLRIDVDRPVFCPEVPNRLSDDFYAVLITPTLTARGSIQPTPLTDPSLRHVLDSVEAALASLPRLSGHEKLEIAAAISEARTGAPIVLRPSGALTLDPAQTERLERAAALQKVLRPELDRLECKLARYAERVRKHGLEGAVTRLGLQADLGAALQMTPSKDGFVPRLARRHRRGSVLELWQSTQNILAAFESCLGRMQSASADGAWIGAALLPVHGTLLDGIAPPADAGRYRSARMQIRSPFGDFLHEPALPADRVVEAIDAFAQGFDRRLWAGIHPLLRAGIGHIEFERIHAFGDGNGRLGRLLLLTMLIEDFLPGLPLEAVLTWNRDTYLERVDAAIRRADLLGFMQFLLRATDKAIELGRRFVPSLAQYRDALFPAFAELGGRSAMKAAEHAASMLLGPDEQFAVQMMMDPNCLCDYLARAGLDLVSIGAFDVIGHRVTNGWSSPVARDLLIAPPAKI